MLHTATHLFTKSVSCSSAKFTTGNFECVVRLKRFTLKKVAIEYLKILEGPMCSPGEECTIKGKGDQINK